MYDIEFRLASKNGWHTPQEAQNYYGKYSRVGITVHWWGAPESNPDSAHDNIVNYILGKAQAGTGSVNYVLSNNKITMLVNPDNVAWASQGGNPTTVSVEFSPHLNAEGYKKAGWLINELEGRYNRALTLYPHNHWFATQCPGSLDLNRMRDEANRWKRGDYTAKPVPVPTPAPAPVAQTVPITWKEWDEGAITYVVNKDTHLWRFDAPTFNMTSVKPLKKGELLVVVGHGTNTKIKRDYYVTQYSLSRKIPNGVNPADLDIYVAPSPVTPVPPPSQQPVPTPVPVEPDIAWIKRALQAILDFLKIKL